ncbi:MAG: hypothetical protein AABZ30_08450 [Myxococcota bacterium]
MAESDDLDLASRILCPDGTCIGVVGGDGRCKLCGAVYDPKVPERPPPPPRPAPAPWDGDEPAADLDDRVLCTDGACVGVIGADGRCRECGKSASSSPY